MDRDDDLAAALPRPPLPSPARRQGAIEEAMRRFDGGEAGEAKAAAGAPELRAGPWWREPARSWAPAFATVLLALLIALPVAWSVIGERMDEVAPAGRPQPSAVAPAADEAIASADSDDPAEPADEARSADESVPPAPAADRRTPPAPADEIALARVDASEFGAAPAPPPPSPPPPAARADSRPAREEKRGDRLADASGEITVTGSRVRQPNLSASSPVTTVGESESDEGTIITTGSRTRSAGRGDWNACTVEDPRRSLSGCRHLVDPRARGAAGQASARVAEGLSSAWQGDYRDAIAAFDRAVAASPRSAFAYLNRGLARQRAGDLDRALADLDQAVKYAPRTARLYYHRAKILRQRGDEKRARADERRAVNLDPDYQAVVP